MNSAPNNRITDFTFLPNTFHFGSDPQLTVITGYLQMEGSLVEAAKRRQPLQQYGEPTAFIVAYDVEYAELYLYCVDANNVQYQIHLYAKEMLALYSTLCCAIRKFYRCTPEQHLNAIRATRNLPALPAKPFVIAKRIFQ